MGLVRGCADCHEDSWVVDEEIVSKSCCEGLAAGGMAVGVGGVPPVELRGKDLAETLFESGMVPFRRV